MNEQAGIRSRSYASGDWYGVIGSRVTVVLPPQERARVPALWALVDDGAGFEEVLDALIGGGLRDLSGFVLLGDTDGVTLAVVRGSARVSVVAAGEQVELEGSQSTTWVERSWRDVTSLVVRLHDVPDTARSYAIEHGLVRLGRLSEGAAVDDTDRSPLTTTGAVVVADHLAVAGSGPAADPGTADPGTAGPLPLSTAGSDPLWDPLPGPSEGTDPGGEDRPASSTVLGDSEPVRAGESLVALGAAPDVDSWIDPGPASPPDLAGPDAADHEVTEVLPVHRSVDPEGTEPFSPLDDDVLRDVDGEDREGGAGGDREGTDVDQGDDPLGLSTDIGGQDDLDDPDRWGDTDGAPVDPVDPDATDAWSDDAAADDAAADEAGDQAAYDDPDDQPDHDGATRTSPWDEAGLSLVRPGIHGQEPAPAVTSRPVARLLVSDGRRIDVDRVVVLGRAPSARRLADDGDPLLVRVESPHQEISATHLEIRPGSGADHGTAVVTDLGSTNGTVVAQPGLEPDELRPGVSVQLLPGAIIDLGDGVTLQVVRP